MKSGSSARNSASVRTAPFSAVTDPSSGSSSGASERQTAVHDGSTPTIGTPSAT